MFRGLINDAKAAAGSLIGKYAARASVAIPFVIAVAFATAAMTLMLADRFGAITAAWIIAGGYTVLGLMMTLIVTVKEQEEEIAEEKAEASDTAGVAADAATQAAMQAPIALLGMILSTPLGPTALAGGAKMAARNLPLVALLALIGFLFWPSAPSEEAAEAVEDDATLATGRLNGSAAAEHHAHAA